MIFMDFAVTLHHDFHFLFALVFFFLFPLLGGAFLLGESDLGIPGLWIWDLTK